MDEPSSCIPNGSSLCCYLHKKYQRRKLIHVPILLNRILAEIVGCQFLRLGNKIKSLMFDKFTWCVISPVGLLRILMYTLDKLGRSSLPNWVLDPKLHTYKPLDNLPLYLYKSHLFENIRVECIALC